MRYFFSPSQKPAGGFYIDSINKAIPDDAVEITEQEWRSLREAQSKQGKRLVVRDGKAVPVEPEEAMDVDELKRHRERKARDFRRQAEAQGVTVMGIRFGGSDKERVDLLDALEYASDANLSVFPVWKDSDGQYHENVPVSAIQDAASQLRALRFQLISDEASEVSRIRKAKTKGEL